MMNEMPRPQAELLNHIFVELHDKVMDTLRNLSKEKCEDNDGTESSDGKGSQVGVEQQGNVEVCMEWRWGDGSYAGCRNGTTVYNYYGCGYGGFGGRGGYGATRCG